jgi:hypothetical protein
MSKELLNPEKALIFRIVHRDNLDQLLENGCRCKSDAGSEKYVDIGNKELIQKRTGRLVPCGPGGALSDYVPFYFTPYSPMLYNIKTGYNGIQKQPLTEILILVASLRQMEKNGTKFVFSDRHAYLKAALFSSNLRDLDRIIWPVLQERNFRKDDIQRFEKYQAEALIHKHVPLSALSGIVCFNQTVKASVQAALNVRKLDTTVLAKSEWYP